MAISQLEMNNNEQGLKYELEEYNPEKPKSSKGGVYLAYRYYYKLRYINY